MLQNLKEIIQKPYQERTIQQHNRLVEILSINFAKSSLILSKKQIKMLTFYLSVFEGQRWILGKDHRSQSIVISNLSINGSNHNSQQLHIITRESKIYIQKNMLCILISFANYNSCMSFGQSSIQEEISFLASMQYFSNMLKKRLYWLIRNSQIVSYVYSEKIYQQGDLIDPEKGSVYFVRKGQLSYTKYIKTIKQSTNIYKFGEGQIFGTFQLLKKDLYRQTLNRSLGVITTSSQAVVYQFTIVDFFQQIRPLSDSIITTQLNLLSYINSRIQSSQKQRKSRIQQVEVRRQKCQSVNDVYDSTPLPLISSKVSRVSSIQMSETMTKLMRQTKDIEKQQNVKYNKMQLNSPRKGVESYKQLQQLRKTQQKFNKLRTVMKIGTGKGRNEILFGLFKTSWESDRAKKSYKRKQHLY